MSFLRNTYAVLRREVNRMARLPMYWILTIVLPLVSFAFFAVMFYKGVPEHIPIAVLDEDQTELSRQLVSMFGQTVTSDVRYEIQSMHEGERMMREGKISAIVLIPSDFQKDILSNTQTHVVSYVSGMNISVNGMLSKDLLTTVTTFSSGVQIQVLMKQGLTEAQAYQQMMPVRFDRHVLFNPYINYGYYLLPSFLPMMMLIFALLSTIFAIGTELKGSTAGEWFETAGGSTWAMMVGKLLPIHLILLVMMLVMDFVMYVLVGVPLNGSFWILLLAGIEFILAYQMIGVLIVSVLSNMRLSLSIGGGYSVLAFTFSGLTFPLMAMGTGLKVFSCIFPFTFYTKIFVDQALRGAPIIYSIQDMGWMALFVILPLLCMPRLRKIATDKTYWGRI